MKRPLLVALGSCVLGILAVYYRLPFPLILGLGLLLTASGLLLPHKEKAKALVLLGAFCLAVISASLTFGESGLAPYYGETAAVTGVVDSLPTRKEEALSFPLKILTIDGVEVAEKLQVRLAQGDKTYRAGDVISFGALVEKPQGLRNPGGFDYALYLKGQGIDSVVYLRAGSGISSAGHKTTPFYLLQGLRGRLLNLCDELFPGESAQLIRGVLLGDKGGDAALAEDFRRAGVSHVLAISGLHVGLIYAFARLLLDRLKVGGKLRLPLMAAVLCFYLFLTGFSASVIRATLMLLAVAFGETVGEEYDGLSALSLAGLLILITSPAQLFAAGFQLSFAAVLGITLFYGPACKLWQKHFRQPGSILSSLFLTACASVVTLPITFYHFQTFNPISFLANLIVVPLIGLILPLAIGPLVVGLLVLPLAKIIALPAAIFARFCLDVTGFFAGVELFTINRGGFGGVEICFLILAAFVLTGYFNFRRASARIFVFSALPFLLTVALVSLWLPRPLTVTFLDVGQGTATLIETPGGGAYLVDGGGYEEFGGYSQNRTPISQEVLLPALYAKNIRRLDGVFISHNHADHAQGIEELLQSFPVTRIYVNSKYNGEHLLAQDKIPVTPLGQGDELQAADGTRFNVVWPDSKVEAVADDEQNEASLVVRVGYGGRSLLLTGDIGAETEMQLKAAEVDCDVLAVPHHGSNGSTCEEFVAATTPQVAIISVGRYNTFGHPRQEVIERLEQADVRVYRTDEQGAVEVKTDGEKLNVRSYLAGE